MTAISDYPSKSYPGATDYVLIADGADSYNYKKVGARNLALNPVLTKALLALLPTTVRSCIVRQRDVSSTDTAYSGVFNWDDSDQSTNVTRDPAGGCYVPPDSDPTGASGCWVRTYSTDAINPEWFGNDRDDVTFQLCADFLNAGDGMVIQPGSTWTFDVGVIIDQVDVKIFSQSYPMALPVIQAGATDISNGALKGLLIVRGQRCAIHGIAFWGTTGEIANGTNEWGTSIGINFDSSSVTDAETQANIDSRVTSCSFQSLLIGIRMRGRNVKISQNTFTYGRYGIYGVIHTYDGGTKKSAFRGFEIIDNRFHSVGAKRVYLYDTVTDPTVCILFPSEQDTIPTGGVAFSDNLIHINHADWSVGLYHGAIHSTSIVGNHCQRSSGPLVYCDMSGYSTQDNAYAVAKIANNMFWGRADYQAVASYYTARYAIYLKQVANVTIKGNSIAYTGLDAIMIDGNSYWCTIDDNTIIQANHSNLELGDAAAIYINAIATMRVKGNTIMGSEHNTGIYINDGWEYVFCDGNQIDVPRAGQGYEIASSGASPWALPGYVGFKCDNSSAVPDWDYNGEYEIYPYAVYPGPRRCTIQGVAYFPYGRIKLVTNPPASASAAGEEGMFTWAAGYIYVCTATDTWKRVAIATW